MSTTDNGYVYAENGEYRVRIEQETYCESCTPELYTALVSCERVRTVGLCSQYSPAEEIRKEEALARAVERWGNPSASSFGLVRKYMRAYFGAELYYFYSADIRGWYVGTDQHQVGAYESWCEGGVCSIITEKRRTGVKIYDDQPADFSSQFAEWEEVDAVGGYLGVEYAEETARALFAELTKEK